MSSDATKSPSVRQNIVVNGRSSASGGTVSVQVVYCSATFDSSGAVTGETIKGFSAVTTLTAGTSLFEASYYAAPDSVFDSHGAQTCRILVTALAYPNTATLWVGSY